MIFGIVVFCLLSGSYLAQAQAFTEFTPEKQFLTPANNGTINFAVNGTYAQAKQENNSWIFSELKLSTSTEALPYIQIAIQNCNITVLRYGRFSSLESAGILRYNVTGHGIQSFNFNLEPQEREWSVIFDGEFLPEGKGWHLADDEIITVTRQATNITLFYMDLPEDVGENSGLVFYQRHSVAIVTGIIVAIVVVVAIILRVKNQKNSESESSK